MTARSPYNKVIVQKVQVTRHSVDKSGMFPVVKTEKSVEYRIKPIWDLDKDTIVLAEREVEF